MYLIIHGHFYQPPRENPWTGRIPSQESAFPYHDWNERICAECYAPNARSRVLDSRGRIEVITNNYDRIHFDFGPTLLRWLEKEKPHIYREILEADARSVTRHGGHGNAIAQAYSHMILPLANARDKRTQILWGLRDFEHRFGRRSESIWLPETAVDPETLQILSSFEEVRYLILAPAQARRIRPLSGGRWTDVSNGRIDPRRPYRLFLKDGKRNVAKSIDLFFYDGPLASGISFNHLLRNAATLAGHIEDAARDAAEATLVSVATDGEIYGHHEPFGDMCLAYLFSREAGRRGFRLTNYGHYLENHPPEHEVELDFGEKGLGSSWSCVHGVDRWQDDCGCQTGGQPGWNQKWRNPLRQGLNRLRDRLGEIYLERCGAILRDPWKARDDSIDVLLDPSSREDFLKRHTRRIITEEDRRMIWRLIESQHQGMLVFTSCAWFFSDVSGIETRQNLTHAARAIDLAQPFSKVDLEEELLAFLAAAQSNVPGIGTGADVWRDSVRSTRESPAQIAIESFGAIAAGIEAEDSAGAGLRFELEGLEGTLEGDAVHGLLSVTDRATEEVFRYSMEARRDPDRMMVISAREEGREMGEQAIERSLDDLPREIRARIARALFTDILAVEERRIDQIFEETRTILERYRSDERVLPPVFKALAADVLERRCSQIARRLGEIPTDTLTGPDVLKGSAETFSLAQRVGVEPGRGRIAVVIEDALAANLGDPSCTTEEDALRSIELLQTAETAGIEIARTRLEENVYALLAYRWGALEPGSADVPEPRGGLSPDTLAQLAELSNLSLRSFERMQSATSEENVKGVTG